MKFKSLLAALTLTMTAPAAMASLATCGSGSTFMFPGSIELFGNSFSSAQSFDDCYSFTLTSPADAFGGTLTIDPLSILDIDVTSVTLSGGGLPASLIDYTAGVFSFSNLLSGSYQLLVSGSVTRGPGWDDILPLPVGYAGALTTVAAPVGSPIPEPGTCAMVLTGLAIGWVVRRRKTG